MLGWWRSDTLGRTDSFEIMTLASRVSIYIRLNPWSWLRDWSWAKRRFRDCWRICLALPPSCHNDLCFSWLIFSLLPLLLLSWLLILTLFLSWLLSYGRYLGSGIIVDGTFVTICVETYNAIIFFTFLLGSKLLDILGKWISNFGSVYWDGCIHLRLWKGFRLTLHMERRVRFCYRLRQMHLLCSNPCRHCDLLLKYS